MPPCALQICTMQRCIAEHFETAIAGYRVVAPEEPLPMTVTWRVVGIQRWIAGSLDR
jgi:hypothetical protein